MRESAFQFKQPFGTCMLVATEVIVRAGNGTAMEMRHTRTDSLRLENYAFRIEICDVVLESPLNV